jgi:CBS domain containing-hemolysin-like protein
VYVVDERRHACGIVTVTDVLSLLAGEGEEEEGEWEEGEWEEGDPMEQPDERG